jgi:uncharacterized protein
VILVDANMLLYAEDSLSPRHRQARVWWDHQLSGTDPVCLCWAVLSAFIRVSTNSRAFERPLALEQSLARVCSWLDQPCVKIIQPTERHWTVFQQMLTDGQAVANLVTDAHLAALAIEHGCELISTDSDFARFPTLVWKNPLSSITRVK